MKDLLPGRRVTDGFQRLVLSAVQLLLMVLIVLVIFELGVLLWRGVQNALLQVHDVRELQTDALHGFAGALLVLIGLELLETVRAYLEDHHVRLEVVLIVAIIAVGRHIIMLDLERINGVSLVGIAALMVSVTLGMFLIRRAQLRRTGHLPAKPREPVQSPSPGSAQ